MSVEEIRSHVDACSMNWHQNVERQSEERTEVITIGFIASGLICLRDVGTQTIQSSIDTEDAV